MENLEFFNRIKRLTLFAMVSNDQLMDTLVLKGGNAIDIVYQLSGRSSIDLDFSMNSEFKQEELDSIQTKIEKELTEVFRGEGYVVFDVKFTEKPKGIGDFKEREFWGGYQIEFKLIPESFYSKHHGDIESLRRNAVITRPDQKAVFKVDISKFEYCEPKVSVDIEGYQVFVYSTEMLVLEKIRAICQQTHEYREILQSHDPVPRSRDFYDIYIITKKFPIDMQSERIKMLLESIFYAKRVPLNSIRTIKDYRDLHRADFDSLKDTVLVSTELNDFDFYFDYVLNLLEQLDIKNP